MKTVEVPILIRMIVVFKKTYYTMAMFDIRNSNKKRGTKENGIRGARSECYTVI